MHIKVLRELATEPCRAYNVLTARCKMLDCQTQCRAVKAECELNKPSFRRRLSGWVSSAAR